MKHCPGTERLQALLDEELDAPEAAALRSHLRECASCATELAAYERLFATLARATALAPRPLLTHRILSRVLPSKVRERWVRALGWIYGGATAALVTGLTLWLSQPAGRALARQGAGALVHGSAQVMVAILEALAVNSMRLPDWMRDVQSFGRMFTPLGRALEESIRLAPVQVSVGAALFACAMFFNWMRTRERGYGRDVRKGGPHVGVLVA